MPHVAETSTGSPPRQVVHDLAVAPVVNGELLREVKPLPGAPPSCTDLAGVLGPTGRYSVQAKHVPITGEDEVTVDPREPGFPCRACGRPVQVAVRLIDYFPLPAVPPSGLTPPPTPCSSAAVRPTQLGHRRHGSRDHRRNRWPGLGRRRLARRPHPPGPDLAVLGFAIARALTLARFGEARAREDGFAAWITR